MSQEYLDNTHAAIRRLKYHAGHLAEYANSLRHVGMIELSNDLYALAGLIEDDAEVVRFEMGKKIHNDYDEAQKSTANILKMALTGKARK